jgi:hypothetical protein
MCRRLGVSFDVQGRILNLYARYAEAHRDPYTLVERIHRDRILADTGQIVRSHVPVRSAEAGAPRGREPEGLATSPARRSCRKGAPLPRRSAKVLSAGVA